MRKIALLSAGLAGMLTLILPATPARALSLVTFVSPTGDDFHFNDCSSSTTPCRTFSHAIQNTIPGGEIFCVPGVFDPRSPLDGLFQNFFTIAQSVTIDCGGGMGISFGFITINAPGSW